MPYFSMLWIPVIAIISLPATACLAMIAWRTWRLNKRFKKTMQENAKKIRGAVLEEISVMQRRGASPAEWEKYSRQICSVIDDLCEAVQLKIEGPFLSELAQKEKMIAELREVTLRQGVTISG